MDARPVPAIPRRAIIVRAAPWIAILLVIGSVQLVRGAVADAVVFGVIAVLVALDAAGLVHEPRTVRVRLVALLVVGGSTLVLLAVAPRHGVVAGIVVCAVGVSALVIAWPRPARDPARPRPRRILRGTLLWAAVTVALCLWELSSFLLGREDAAAKLRHPAISDLLDPLVETWPGRLVFIAAWIGGGILLVRAGRRS